MDDICMEGYVAVITGAGQGLGREYARVLASMGALLVINDNAYNERGESIAEIEAHEIGKRGGCAIANSDDISTKEGCMNLIKAVEENFGFADIFIHNAGCIVVKELLDHEDSDWYKVMNVHLNASYHLLKGFIPLMRKKNYGRIVMVTSSNGMFGQEKNVSYAAAKMGIYGLAQAIKLEFGNSDIKCNLISPLAATEQTEGALQGVMKDKLSPKRVAPIIAYLCSEQCRHNGSTFVAAGGYFSTIGFYEGEGVYIPDNELTVQSVYEKINEIGDMSHVTPITSTTQEAKKIFKKIF